MKQFEFKCGVCKPKGKRFAGGEFSSQVVADHVFGDALVEDDRHIQLITQFDQRGSHRLRCQLDLSESLVCSTERLLDQKQEGYECFAWKLVQYHLIALFIV